MNIKKEMKIAEEKLEQQKDKLYEEWKNTWILENREMFYEMFCCNYEYLKQKISYNRNRNFFYKTLYLVVLGVFLISYIAANAYNILIADGSTALFLESGVILIVCIAVCTWVAKVLDIRKYQETWVRHSQHKFKIDMEMLSFLCKQKPYHTDKREDEFEKNVFEIWNKNHNKFVKNMETKEVSIMEGTTATLERMKP